MKQEECEHVSSTWMPSTTAQRYSRQDHAGRTIYELVLVCDLCEKILDRQLPQQPGTSGEEVYDGLPRKVIE